MRRTRIESLTNDTQSVPVSHDPAADLFAQIARLGEQRRVCNHIGLSLDPEQLLKDKIIETKLQGGKALL